MSKLPVPLLRRRAGVTERIDGGLEVFELNDQHAYARVAASFDVRVGDIVGCGISHPCASFDRWRAIPVVDDDYEVVGAIRTFF